MNAKTHIAATWPPALAARLIVCERAGNWAVALRRELGGATCPLHETRSLPQCWEELGQAPGSFVVVELTAAAAGDLLRRLARLPGEFPFARVAIVAERSLACWEWLMREAGAVHFVSSPRRLGVLARVAERHLAEVPLPEPSLTEQIWSRLPWGRGRA